MFGNETHPPAPSLTKRRSDEVPLFLPATEYSCCGGREGFRVSYCSKNRVVYHCQLNLQTFKSESFIRY